ncbi:MAG: site-specific DNA-methyltransferase [Chloroflexi bacterium]|nr:site-specific DNA-methyltransferase [Chloroflexota bacterium]
MENINSALENRVILGDVREVVNQLPDAFFQSIITSPPYFRHRSYSGTESLIELGREHSVNDYIHNIVSIFRELRTKLRPDGLLWLNLGDTYDDKSLLGVPWRTALTMKDDGWILRSDIIWHKPNAMPASISDRPTTDHEYVFLFSQNTEYFYNADAIREPHVTFTEKSKMKGGRNHFGKKGGTPENGKNAGNPNLHNGRWDQAFHPKGRNKRTVWEIPLSKFRDVHFAVYPEKLVEICLLASTRENDYVLDPFTGSGTTGVVACKYRRKFTGIELVKRYQEMAQARIDSIKQSLLFNTTVLS